MADSGPRHPGNRDINKMRITSELAPSQIERLEDVRLTNTNALHAQPHVRQDRHASAGRVVQARACACTCAYAWMRVRTHVLAHSRPWKRVRFVARTCDAARIFTDKRAESAC
eukprot:3607597-Pleurochrysis_carterae.AAC.6